MGTESKDWETTSEVLHTDHVKMSKLLAKNIPGMDRMPPGTDVASGDVREILANALVRQGFEEYDAPNVADDWKQAGGRTFRARVDSENPARAAWVMVKVCMVGGATRADLYSKSSPLR